MKKVAKEPSIKYDLCNIQYMIVKAYYFLSVLAQRNSLLFQTVKQYYACRLLYAT